MPEINFLVPECPYISNFKTKRRSWNFRENRRWPSIVHRRDFSCSDSYSEGLKTPRRWFWVIFINIENFLGFLTTLTYTLKEARQHFFIFKNMFSVLWNPPALIFRRVEISWADWNQNPKVGGPKIGKVWRGVCRVLGPQFLEWKKIKEYDAKNRLKIG